MLADVPARPARARARSVLHRRHRRVRVRPGPEHAGHRSELWNDLHSQRARAVRPRRSVGVRQLRRHLPWPDRRRRATVRRGHRSVHQPLRRILVLARRVREHPAQGVHRFGSGVHAARDREGRAVVRPVLPAVRPPLHLRRQHRHARQPDPDRRLSLAQDVATGDDGRLVHRSDPARSVHDRDDVADRKLHRRRREQRPGVRQVHRAAVTNLPAARARHQRPAEAVAGVRVGHGGRHGRLANAGAVPRFHSALEGRVRGRQTHLRRELFGLVQRPDRVLSGRRAAGARAGHRVDGPPAGRRGASRLFVA